MAGTVPGFSLTPQFDEFGQIMPGCRLYIIQAGTTQTPQNAYQDSGLTILLPNPIVGDASGRIRQFFLADGVIKLRLTDENGSEKFVGDNLVVVGASSGGGGGGTVDPTTIMATGDLKARYGVGVLTGFVRANGRTIGSATSGATERANADCQALFEYLWNTDNTLVVSTGRGASANADWVANKTIAIPDWRGRALAFLDDMGNSPAGRLTASYFGSTATYLGAEGGAESRVLTAANLAPHRHNGSGTTGDDYPDHTHAYQVAGGSAPVANGSFNVITTISSGNTTGASNRHRHDISFTTTDGIGLIASPFAAVSPAKLATIYLKL